MDYIEVRINLPADPRVREVARKTNATIPAVIGVLYTLWSMAYARGDRHGDGDIVVQHYDAEAFEADAELPGVTEALRAVGWLSTTPEGWIIAPGLGHKYPKTGKERERDYEMDRKRRHKVRGPYSRGDSETKSETPREPSTQVQVANPSIAKHNKAEIREEKRDAVHLNGHAHAMPMTFNERLLAVRKMGVDEGPAHAFAAHKCITRPFIDKLKRNAVGKPDPAAYAAGAIKKHIAEHGEAK